MPRFPPSGPAGCRSPSSSVLSKALGFPTARPASLRCLRSAVPQGCTRAFALIRQVHRMSLELITRCLQPGITCGNDRTSQVPGQPQCPFARALRLRQVDCSRPDDAHSVGFQNNRMALAMGTTKALARNNLSKLNHTAFGLAFYASSHSLPRATQDSLPAVGQTLPDGLSTRRVTTEGFRFTSF